MFSSFMYLNGTAQKEIERGGIVTATNHIVTYITKHNKGLYNRCASFFFNFFYLYWKNTLHDWQSNASFHQVPVLINYGIKL